MIFETSFGKLDWQDMLVLKENESKLQYGGHIIIFRNITDEDLDGIWIDAIDKESGALWSYNLGFIKCL